TGSNTLNHAMSNTDGVGTFPANPYSMAGEYGPASTDVRHRVNVGGAINNKWNVFFTPVLIVASGPPFDITAGRDIYGTTLFNGRPGIAADPNRPGVIQTVYGLLDPNPTLDERILHRNYGRGPGTISVNMHVTKAVKLGPRPAEAAQGGSRSSGGREAQARQRAASGEVKRPYTLSITMEMVNIINHTNAGPLIGNITSQLFERANHP